ncbi:MAG: cytochrome c [Myxococcota bacterium]|nr:cytochrome c [Myxococcota bacterium]
MVGQKRCRRVDGKLLLALGFTLGFLAAAFRADPAIADDRVLHVEDGGAERRYTVDELVGALGLAEFEVANDPHFGPDRVFAGFELGPLLEHIGLGDAPELLLVCVDGYRIPFDTRALSGPRLQGFLAIRDAALPADAASHWTPYRHGAELVSFDPFYLVWASSDEGADLGSDTLPWPFQLSGIQRFDRAAYFGPARPPAGAGDAARQGFPIFTAHCGKCHRVRGVGGEVGPALDRQGSLSSLLPTAQLRDYVQHDEARYPRSKMPQFSKLLSSREIDQVVAYLQAMQSGTPPPGPGAAATGSTTTAPAKREAMP